MHEILTLQLGQSSNYVATHFWNTQESYFTYSSDEESIVDHDIHFRPGIGADGTETFTPRTVIYDLKGGFGSLRKINTLYEIEEPTVPQGLWNGPTIVQRQPVIKQNAYQQSLEQGSEPPQLTTESVRFWSDFNRLFFHPRSIVQLNEYDLNSSLVPFESWSTGEELFNSLDKEHDLLDRDLRPFAEEADQMQGIQMVAGIDDAWGGFAARYMDRIRDEYGKAAVWFWGSEDSIRTIPREKRILRLSNTAKSVSEIGTQASMFMPVAMPPMLPSYVMLDSNSQWHRSALYATAIESITLPSRLRLQNKGRETLDQLVNGLNINGKQNLARLQMSVIRTPLPNGSQRSGRLEVRGHSRDPRVPSQDRLIDDSIVQDGDVPTLDMSLFSTMAEDQVRGRRNIKKSHIFGQCENYRGNSRQLDEIQADENDDDEMDEGYTRARRRAAGLPIIHRTKIPLAFPLLDSFPQIFGSTSNTSLEIHTALSTDAAVALRLKSLAKIVNRAVGIDEREALSNSLGDMAEAYEEGWESDSDEDDD